MKHIDNCLSRQGGISFENLSAPEAWNREGHRIHNRGRKSWPLDLARRQDMCLIVDGNEQEKIIRGSNPHVYKQLVTRRSHTNHLCSRRHTCLTWFSGLVCILHIVSNPSRCAAISNISLNIVRWIHFHEGRIPTKNWYHWVVDMRFARYEWTLGVHILLITRVKRREFGVVKILHRSQAQ